MLSRSVYLVSMDGGRSTSVFLDDLLLHGPNMDKGMGIVVERSPSLETVHIISIEYVDYHNLHCIAAYVEMENGKWFYFPPPEMLPAILQVQRSYHKADYW